MRFLLRKYRGAMRARLRDMRRVPKSVRHTTNQGYGPD